MIARYGFSITVRKRDSVSPGIFISGLSLAADECCPIIPFREGDYVPVWATMEEARWMIEEVRHGSEAAWDFRIVAISTTLRAGSSGASPFGLFRGVGGFTIPDHSGAQPIPVRPLSPWTTNTNGEVGGLTL